MFTELFLTCLLPIAVVDRRDALRRTFNAVCIVESHGDPRAYNAAEDGAGMVQIRPILLRDVNRIIGYTKYTLEDRWSPVKSWEIFKTYSLYYAPKGTPEIWARNWVSGPQGHHKGASLAYWAKIEAEMRRAGWAQASAINTGGCIALTVLVVMIFSLCARVGNRGG